MKSPWLAYPIFAAACLILPGCTGVQDAELRNESTISPDVPAKTSGGSGVIQEVLPTYLDSSQDIARFMSYASFGATKSDLTGNINIDAASWIEAEFEKPATLFLPPIQAAAEAGDTVDKYSMRTAHWNAMISAEDQLRQRMVFALSQILVISDKPMSTKPLRNAYYMDVLSNNAFGNYRQLLTDVTYSPAMAQYLTYLRNKKGDPETGRMPDENYARELLQLFTIGLVELNRDGTPILDGTGQPIELFDNEDIVGLARVFTGLSYKGELFWRADDDGDYNPLVSFNDKHSPLEKTFLGLTIPPNTDADTSIEMALDHIFEQESLPPFVCRQLIQRFTQSHPSPEYVERVVTAFESGWFAAPDGRNIGTGERGDLKATIAAILLDEDVIRPDAQTDMSGKIREPVLRFVHWARAFDLQDVRAENERNLRSNAGSTRYLSQQAFSSPSVFNFYRPGFIAPGSVSGAANLNAPEFQISHEGATVGYVNFMTDYVRNNTPTYVDTVDTFRPDYTDEIALADDPEALADHLSALLLAGRMHTQTRDRMIAILPNIPISESDADQANVDRLTRVEIAITMTVTDPAFTVWR